MKRRCFALLALLFLASLKTTAQTPEKPSRPQDVTVCDLMAQPSKYNGQLVRVRGQISIAFESFSLIDKDCPRIEGKVGGVGVWLEYGGDESSPTVYCCGDHSRKPGKVIEEQGLRIPLLRDEQLLEFRRRLSAARQARPDGLMCQERECFFYDVTATLTGHFFAMEQTKAGGISGYGRFGLNHGFLIEQVTEIDARRRQVPAGGIFECKSETWNVPPAERKDILLEDERCHDPECFALSYKHALRMGAKHFGEPLEQLELWGRANGNEESEIYWSSPDLLTTLDFKFPYTNSYIHTSRKDLSVTRTRCSTLIEPLPQSTRINCDTRDLTVEDSESIAKSVQKNVDQGSDLWRLDFKKVAWNAVQDYAAKYSIVLSSNPALESCQSRASQKRETAYCSWKSRDGMQSVLISLIRYGAPTIKDRAKERTVWVQRSGVFSNCKAE